jgi:pantoate--beta-alanine ligase
VPTVREPDGLALSSRNAYLSVPDRERAAALPRALEAAREVIENGSAIDHAIDDARRRLAEAGFAPIDYIALVDAQSLEPLDAPQGEMRLLAAAKIGGTRLIDNLPVRMKSPAR